MSKKHLKKQAEIFVFFVNGWLNLQSRVCISIATVCISSKGKDSFTVGSVVFWLSICMVAK